MKNKSIYAVLLILFFFLSASYKLNLYADANKVETVNNIEKPKLHFEEEIYDFGKIYTGSSVSHSFKFKNLGEGELFISSVKSTCGCTAALLSKNRLQKGEEGQVDVNFNAGQYVGKVTKAVTVNSNYAENPEYKLTITGEVIEEISINPRQVNFGIIRKGDSCTKDIEIKTIPELKIEVKKVESPNQYISIAQNKTNEKNKYNYSVTISKYDYIGRFDGIIFIYTNSTKQERIDIPFSGEIVGDVTFYPDVLHFGSFKKGQAVKRAIIVNFVNKSVKIEKIEIVPNGIKSVVSELNDIGAKKIDLTLSEELVVGKITGSLKIYTTSTLQPIITVPINGEIKE